MRNFMFRAWDTVQKKMVFEDFHIIGETTAFDLIKQYSLEHLNDIKVMQYTGADDINKKSIYEGDIIEWKKRYFDDANVKKNTPSRGIVTYSDSDASFLIDTIKEGTLIFADDDYEFSQRFYSPDGREFDWHEMEVIGNIFENPELKEVEK